MSEVQDRPIQPLAHSVADAARRLGNLPERAVWRLIQDGELRSFKVGRHRLITDAALQELIERRERAAA